MKKDIIGIIVEFNPLHNGHKRLIEEIKRNNPNALIIAAMSGNFVQRGELAIYSKWTRAKYALKYGVDLVIEIPPYYVLNNANIFAKKSVEILSSYKVENIYFGSETTNINEIKLISDYILKNEKKLEKLKKEFHSLPKAFEKLIGRALMPNDILGICYVLEAKKSNLGFQFHSINRISNDKYTSGSKIRKMISDGNKTHNSLIDQEELTFYLEEYSDVILGKIITSDVDNNIIKYLKNNALSNNINSFEHLILSSSNYGFTKSKLRREVLKFVLSLSGTENEIILSMSNDGKSILKENDNYSFRHDKTNSDNYRVESFISIKMTTNVKEELSKMTIISKE